MKLHNAGELAHCGIVLCTADPDFAGQAARIDQALSDLQKDQSGIVVRVNRLSK